MTSSALNYDSCILSWFYTMLCNCCSRNPLTDNVEYLMKFPFLGNEMGHLGTTRTPYLVLMPPTSTKSSIPFHNILSPSSLCSITQPTYWPTCSCGFTLSTPHPYTGKEWSPRELQDTHGCLVTTTRHHYHSIFVK